MSTLTDVGRNGHWLKWIAERRYNLEARIYEQQSAPGQAITYGDVLETDTGDKLKTVTDSTGAEAEAISLTPVTAAENVAGDVEILCLVRGPAVIDSDHLAFSDDDSEKAAALTALAALDIIAVNSDLVTWTRQTT